MCVVQFVLFTTKDTLRRRSGQAPNTMMVDGESRIEDRKKKLPSSIFHPRSSTHLNFVSTFVVKTSSQ